MSSTYEADFLATTPTNPCAPEDADCNDNYDFFFGAGGYQAHDFGSGAAFIEITEDLSELCLFWAEPLSAATSDYDVFVFNETGNLVNIGDNFVATTPPPKECVVSTVSDFVTDPVANPTLVAGNTVVVVNTLAGSAARFMHLSGLPAALAATGTAPERTFRYNNRRGDSWASGIK